MRRPGLRKVVVTGGTGLVGRRLVEALAREEILVAVVSRSPEAARLPEGVLAYPWKELPAVLEGADGVFNLAGEGLADRRWTAERKTAILQSRTESTRRITEALRWVSQKPQVLVNASAVGYYAPGNGVPLDEHGAPGGDFLAKVCQAWEQEADAAAERGVRVAKLRLGVVLAREGGALPRLLKPVKLFAGCALGGGSQGFSWIHIDDAVKRLLTVAQDERYDGPINATAPRPVSQKAFMRMLAGRLHRPLWPVPAVLTRLGSRCLLGEMADAMLLQGAFVTPARALQLGFSFAYPTPEEALDGLLAPGREQGSGHD